MRRPAPCLLTAALLVFGFSLPLGATDPPAESVDALLREGAALHDEGHYDQAIERYRRVLALEPDNAAAFYEMAFSQSAAGRYEACAATAEAGLRLKSPLQARMYTVAGSCLDSAGKGKRAAQLFRRAVGQYPDDGLLAFNFAVTLRGRHEDWKAIAMAERAVDHAPGHASSHKLLAELFLEQGLEVPALLANLRFLSLEPSSERSAQAARVVVGLLDHRAVRKSPSEVTVYVDPKASKRAGDFTVAQLMLGLMAARRYTEEGEKKTDMEHYVASLDGLAGILRESPDHQRSRSWVRKVYVRFLTEAQERGLLEALTYRSLATLGLPGTGEWLETNASRVAALEAWLDGRS